MNNVFLTNYTDLSFLNRIKDSLEPGEESLVELLAAPGKTAFYEKFGFKVKKEVAESGMYAWLKKGK